MADLHSDNQSDNHIEPVAIEATPFQRADAHRATGRQLIGPVPAVLTLLFLTLAAAVFLIFSAKAVKFEFSEPVDSFSLTDGYGYKMGERYLMLAGKYQFSATASGFHPLNETFVVTEDANQALHYTFKPLPGILTITTTPDVEAEVYIDQKLKGTTPLTINEIEPGLHDISLTSVRFRKWDSEVVIEGRRTEQAVNAELVPAWAEVTFGSSPADAAIVIDQTEVGRTPATLEVIEGQHQIALTKSGFKRWESVMTVTAGEAQQLPVVVLEKSDGKVSLSSTPAGANVTINNNYSGQTPLSLTLAPGTSYHIRLSRAGYQPAERHVTITADEDISLDIDMTPVMGQIRLQVQPADSQLYIDGVLKGKPGQLLNLTTSPHKIRITKPGYAEFTTTVTPQVELAQQLSVTLQTLEAFKAASIPQEITSPTGKSLKLILPGEFQMGADRREPGRRSNEIEKSVKLTRAYYLGIHEITNAEYKQFNSQHDSGVLGRSLLSEDERPVVNLGWDDAVRFCNWLSQKAGLPAAYEQQGGKWLAVTPMTTGYRLPTEAEWAWAARYANGDKPTRFPWGEAMPPTSVDANYADETAANMVPYILENYNDSYRGPAPVGQYSPNAFGIYDLAGNVSEWIHDIYGLETPHEVLIDPTGPLSGDYHVIRGSNYTHGRFSELRWTYRDYGDKPRTDVGLRIARYLE